MLSNEEFFVCTIQDLRQRVEQFNTYNTIRISALLRQLFLDSPSLFNLVNRYLRHKIIFKVSNSMLPPGRIPAIFSAYIIPDNDFIELSLSSFLSLKVVFINDASYSIADIIRVIAHTHGGVHSYSQGEKEKRLKALNQTLHLLPKNTVPNIGYLVKEIAIVSLTSLEPLEALIIGRSTTGRF